MPRGLLRSLLTLLTLGRLVVILGLVASPGCRREPAASTVAGVPAIDEPDPPEDPPADAGLAPPTGAQPVPAPPPRPVLDEAIRAAREHAQRHVLRKGDPLLPDLLPRPEGALPGSSLPADPLPGFFTPLVFPADKDPLAAFEAALAALEAGTRQAPVRLAFYGASGTAADLWTAYVRAYLQRRFGDGGPGVVAAARPTRWYRHHELSIKASKHWTRHHAIRMAEGDPGRLGLMGLAMSASSRRAWSEIGPSRRSRSAREITRYTLYFLLQPGGGRYTVKVDAEVAAELSTALPGAETTPRLGQHALTVPAGAHTLRLEVAGDGEVWMLGVVAETGRPGVVLDTLGVEGMKISDLVGWDEALWAEHVRDRGPVLYILGFGTNSSVDEDEPIEDYEVAYRTVLERFGRALPEASCVIMGPGDFPRVDGDALLPRPRLDQIREIQRRLAPEYGCAFWDGLQFVGGTGAKAAWVEAGLARDDYLHLTRRGYVRLGLGFADALVHRYDWKTRAR